MELQSVAYMNILYGVHSYLIADWDDKFVENIYTAINICKSQGLLVPGDKIMVVNDIQK
jgi:pyruvate kinase